MLRLIRFCFFLPAAPEFPTEDGERIIAEITLDENAEIEDLYCTCRAGGLCVHLAAMMCDMEERKTVFFSGRMQE